MKPTSRIETLQKRHALLSALIEQEEKTKSADDLFIQKLKKQKLALKDVMLNIRDLGKQSTQTDQASTA